VKSFNDLEWRIDVKLATKSLQKQIDPEIILKLNLKSNENKSEIHILQTDIVNLVHLTNCLDDALNEMKSNYCRRIFKNLI
jgi:COMM domain containing 2